LKALDGREVTRTERYQAGKKFEENRREIIQLQVNVKHISTADSSISRVNLMDIKLIELTFSLFTLMKGFLSNIKR
jgi:hypothetical protein